MIPVPGVRFLNKGKYLFKIKIQSHSQYLQSWILCVINIYVWIYLLFIATKGSDEKYDFLQMCGFHLQYITETLVF